MARYDKYEPKGGGFRAALAEAFVVADINIPFAVGLDASGHVVKGAGNSGIVGVLVLGQAMNAGDIVDVMTSGEIVEATLSDGTTALDAGTAYFADDTTGELGASAEGAAKVGFTVEATRLIVRLGDLAVTA